MDERVKGRLVGAAILVSVFVIVTPMLLEDRPRGHSPRLEPLLPPAPAETFPSVLQERTELPAELSEAFPETLPEGVPFEEPLPSEDPGVGAETAPAPASQPAGSDSASAAALPPPPEPPARDPSAPPVATPAPAGVDGTRVGLSAWAVQLSTFGNAANAIALRNALRGRGFVAFVERTPEKATRVYVGPELQRQKAVSAQERLVRELGITGTVVPYPASPPP